MTITRIEKINEHKLCSQNANGVVTGINC